MRKQTKRKLDDKLAAEKKTKKKTTKKAGKISKRINRQLTCAMSADDVCRAADMLSYILAERDSLKLRQKSAADNFRAELKNLDRGVGRFANKVRSKTEGRDVVVAITYDLKKGMVTEVRTDTGEVIDRRAIEDAERPDLFGDVDPKSESEKKKDDKK